MSNMATSLAEKYASLANTEPVLQDPEENTFFETAARVDDKFEEDDSDLYFGSSQLRQRNAQLLVEQDSRYSGRKISRKTLVDDEDEEETGSDVEESESDDDDDEEEEEEVEMTRDFKASASKNTKTTQRTVEKDDDYDDNNSKSGSEGESEDLSSDNDSEEDITEDEEDDSTLTLVPETDMVQKFSEINIDQEVQKGKAVQAQLVLWDKLLESRIKMQKMLSLSNYLPQHETWQAFINQGGKEYQDLVRTNKRFIKTLLEKLLLLQEQLLQMNPSTSQMVDENQGKPEESASDEEIPSDTEEEDAENNKSEQPATSISETQKKRKLRDEDLEELLEKRYKSFKLYRNATIQKWNDKVRLSSGKVGQKSFAAFEQSALKQIEQILNDRDRLRKRTQLKRSTYRVLGKIDSQKEDVNETVDVNSQISDKSRKNDHLKDYDQEIFDDDDFYHQLLRELIERKTADVKDPIAISRQWLEIQKLRSKIKKKVDTKASKGRKVRFDVHAKLVNFMAPIDNHEMTDEAKDELFRSLFGKQSFQPG